MEKLLYEKKENVTEKEGKKKPTQKDKRGISSQY